MFETDLHVHSIRSSCGFHTLMEIVGFIKAKGLKGFALTDHGPALATPRAHFSVMIRRVPKVIDGIRVLKGIEASVMTTDGEIDLPRYKGDLKFDIVLSGLHEHDAFETNPGKRANTRALVEAMRRNPELKVITHPYYHQLPVDLDAVTEAACETGTALEVNNSHILMAKAEMDHLYRMLELVREKSCPIAVNSDGHVFHEMGETGRAIEILKEYGLDSFTIVNRTLESTLEFLGLEA